MEIEGRAYEYPHVFLAQAVQEAMRRAESPEEEIYQSLFCILSTAFMVEGYLNFLGEVLFSDWHPKEPKELRNSKAGQDWKAKRKDITERLGKLTQSGSPARSPFRYDPKSQMHQYLVELFEFRKRFVHPKTAVIKGKKSRIEDFQSPWMRQCNLVDAKRYYGAGCDFIQLLHGAAYSWWSEVKPVPPLNVEESLRTPPMSYRLLSTRLRDKSPFVSQRHGLFHRPREK